MPRPKTSGRDRKTCDRKLRKAAAGAKTEGNDVASSQARAPSDMAVEEMLVESLIRDLNEARKLAFSKGRPTAAVDATLAMRQLLLLLPDKPGRPPSLHKPGRGPAPPAKFDGNYNDAVRRLALLLRLAAKERAEEADGANGQKRDRPS